MFESLFAILLAGCVACSVCSPGLSLKPSDTTSLADPLGSVGEVCVSVSCDL